MKRIIAALLAMTLTLSFAFMMSSCAKDENLQDEQEIENGIDVTDVVDANDADDVSGEVISGVLPVKDIAGNDIVVPDSIEKIIVASPQITEMLVAIGLGDKIAAIDAYSVGLEGIKTELPIFDLMSPDNERILEIEPDIIFATTMIQADGLEPLYAIKQAGICVVYLPTPDDIKGIKESILFVGAVTKNDEKANEMVSAMEAEIAKIAEIGATVTEKKSVYFEISAAPYMYSLGTGVYLNEMIELTGAVNIFADKNGWLAVDTEMLFNGNPDVILTNVNYLEDPIGEILARENWGSITAVQNGEVYQISNNPSSLANQNIVIALKEIAKAVYPDLYVD